MPARRASLECLPQAERVGLTPLERAHKGADPGGGPDHASRPIWKPATLIIMRRATRSARDGDFTTAPEISQMFGELVGAALADCWAARGGAGGCRLCRARPGPRDACRRCVAGDARRRASPVRSIWSRPAPSFASAQAERVPDARSGTTRSKTCPRRPLLLVANEFFDALPVRQFVDGIERRVMVPPDGLAFDRDGEIVETSPAREAAIVRDCHAASRS